MNDQENYIRLVNASRDGNLQAIKDDDKLDVDMIYNLVLNSYKDNYDANDDDEMVADWLNDYSNDIKFSVHGNSKFDGNNADEIVKIDNILELKDKFFDLDGNIVE